MKSLRKTALSLLLLTAITFAALTSCGGTSFTFDPAYTGGLDYYAYRDTRPIADESKITYIRITVKDFGEMTVLLDANIAPLTVAHFLSLVDEGFYNGKTFHRMVKGFMIQGGSTDGTSSGSTEDTVFGEFSANGWTANNLRHRRGVISMARATDKNSASCQFFICDADAMGTLDGSYAAFGYVVEGLSVVDHIISYHEMGGFAEVIGDKSKQPVITSIERIEGGVTYTK